MHYDAVQIDFRLQILHSGKRSHYKSFDLEKSGSLL
jgi:hypothetical protein